MDGWMDFVYTFIITVIDWDTYFVGFIGFMNTTWRLSNFGM